MLTKVNKTKLPASKASKIIEKISNILSNKNKSNKKISQNILRYKNKRIAYNKIIKAQNELFVDSSLKKISRSKSFISMPSIQFGGDGVLSKLIRTAGFITSGWLLSNMPTWIAGAKELSNRIGLLKSTFTRFVDNIWNMISSIGQISKSLFENFKTFDFTDSEYKVRNSITELTDTIDNMGEQIIEAFSVLTEPFLDIPPLGTEAGPGAYPDSGEYPGVKPDQPDQSSQSSPSGGNADFWTLVAIVSREDGDPQGQADVAQSIYNRAKSGAYGSSNIRELILREGQYEPTWQRPKKGQRGKPNPEWFQINDAKSAAKASGFSEGAIKSVAANITNPSLQKNAAEFVQGRTDFKGANSPFPGGIQRKSGDNYFGWQYGYKGKTIASIPNLGVSPGTSSSPSTAKPTPSKISSLPPLPPTNTLGGGVQSYGALRKGGRRHAGVDFDAPDNGTFYSRIGGEVVFIGNDPGGYYKYVDIFNSELGVTERIAEGDNILVKMGQKVSPGDLVAKGTRSTGVFHYEIRKGRKRTYGFSGTLDPIAFLKSPSSQFQIASTPSTPLLSSSPTSQTTQVTNEVQIQSPSTKDDSLNAMLMSANLAKKRQSIVLINDLQPPSSQIPIRSINRGGSLIMRMSDGEVVNSFIKNKLLLDLTYL